MKDYLSQRITCPHCGHHIHLDLDASMGDQDYIEDCTACCNPIHLNMHLYPNNLNMYVSVGVKSDLGKALIANNSGSIFKINNAV